MIATKPFKRPETSSIEKLVGQPTPRLQEENKNEEITRPKASSDFLENFILIKFNVVIPQMSTSLVASIF
ncbi:MAG: hypothetical protein AAFO07_22730 [Bacteroidota bacterium]